MQVNWIHVTQICRDIYGLFILIIILVLRLSLFCRSGGCGVHTSSDGVTLDVEEVGALQKDLWIDSTSEILIPFAYRKAELSTGWGKHRVGRAKDQEWPIPPSERWICFSNVKSFTFCWNMTLQVSLGASLSMGSGSHLDRVGCVLQVYFLQQVYFELACILSLG